VPPLPPGGVVDVAALIALVIFIASLVQLERARRREGAAAVQAQMSRFTK
jgi:hypothetical protein